MGRKLIVNGADFSANGMLSEYSWWIDYNDAKFVGGNAFANTDKFIILPSEITRLGLSGKVVNCVRLYAIKSGTVSIGGATVSPTDNIASSDNITSDESFNVTAGINILHLATPVTISTSKSMWVTGKEILTYKTNNTDADDGWIFRALTKTSINNRSRIAIDFGYYSGR